MSFWQDPIQTTLLPHFRVTIAMEIKIGFLNTKGLALDFLYYFSN